MQTKKTIELLINTITMGAEYTIELFHSNANRAESYAANHLNGQAGFVSNNLPSLTIEGILSIATNAIPIAGVIGWQNDKMIGVDNAGAQEWTIESGKGVKFSYRSILNDLSSKIIRIGKVRITGANIASLSKQWKIRKYSINGTLTTEDIVLSNMVSPEQVQSNILEFNLDREIDGNTAIEIITQPGEGIYISMEYEEIKK